MLNKYTVYFGYDSDDDGYKRDDTPIPRRNVGSNQSPITRLLTSVGMRLTVGERQHEDRQSRPGRHGLTSTRGGIAAC